VLAHLVPPAEPEAQARNSASSLANASGSETRSVLHDRVVLLQTNHRSQEQIRTAADAINRQDASLIDRLPCLTGLGDQQLDAPAGCWLLEQTLEPRTRCAVSCSSGRNRPIFAAAWADDRSPSGSTAPTSGTA